MTLGCFWRAVLNKGMGLWRGWLRLGTGWGTEALSSLVVGQICFMIEIEVLVVVLCFGNAREQ
jgi:hypothetical protein